MEKHPTGDITQTAFAAAAAITDRGMVRQVILAIGRQDVDPCSWQTPAEVKVMAANCGYLIVESAEHDLLVGEDVTFQINCGTLVGAMTSPFVTKIYLQGQDAPFDRFDA